MKTKTRQNIYNYIENNEPISVKSIVDFFGISKEMIHRHLKRLIEEWKIYKVWKSPKVYYFSKKDETINMAILWFVWDYNNLIEENFVYFWANGEVVYWVLWFEKWCQKRNLDSIKESENYIKVIQKYDSFKDKNWFINWQEKMNSAFDEVYLDKTFYFDFYSIEKYWKTLLWNLMLYAKQTSDKELSKKVVDIIFDKIYKLINFYDIDWIAFIPPSIDRKIQLMDEIKKWLHINLWELKLIKIFKDKPVPQKSLNKKHDRIINASETIFIWDKNFKAKNILLIDDAIWSGATLNFTAKKIKQNLLAQNVIWLAIVWSFKWFEVINEV